MKKRDNANETITRLPILLASSQDEGDGWVATPKPTQLRGESVTMLAKVWVRVVPIGALAQFASTKTRRSFETVYGSVREDFSQQLLLMLGIAGATRENNLAKVANLVERAATTKSKLAASFARLSAIISPWDTVASTLNTGLYGSPPTMLVLWQKESHFAPALLCHSSAQALFAHALFEVGGERGVRFCSRCRNPFFATRERHSFCGYKCRTADAMKRYRANLKSKAVNDQKAARKAKR